MADLNCLIGPPKFPCLIILILLAASSAICIVSISYGGKVSFASRVLLLIVCLVSVPSVVNFLIEDWGKQAIAFAEALISTAIVAIFSVWFLGLTSLDIWLGILFLLLLLLLEGAYLLERIQDKVIKRLSNTKQFLLSSAETTRLKENAKSQILLYGSLPLGLILATGYGWIFGLSEAQILSLSIPIILSVASLILVIRAC